MILPPVWAEATNVNEGKNIQKKMPSDGLEDSFLNFKKNELNTQTEEVFKIIVKKQNKEDLSIKMKFEAGDFSRKLGVGIKHNKDRSISFAPYINYPDFIVKKTLFFYNSASRDLIFSKTVENIITLSEEEIFGQKPFPLSIVLRVEDKKGIFDETTEIKVPNYKDVVKKVDYGFGISHLKKANIPLRGGLLSVFGENVLPGSMVLLDKVQAPVDGKGKFIADIILPPGATAINVNLINKNGTQQKIQKNIEIKENEIFFFAMLDITYGENTFTGPLRLQEARAEEFENEYLYGQAGFYLKGKIKGKYIITAMANSGEAEFKDIFRNLNKKDTKQLLRRLDADRFYPVYGDNSSASETAPTQGRLYLRIAKDKSHIVWGNYETSIVDNEFSQINRTFYGALINLESNQITKFGESKNQVSAFFSDPTTFPVREEFQGTGGSVYFLSYQDLNIGSEKIKIITRDRNSGRNLSVKNLYYGKDYDIDYLQGRIILHEPLSSSSGDSDVVTSGGAQFGNPVFLVLDYEVTPVVSSLKNNYTIGGNANKWFGDKIKLGATYQKTKSNLAIDNDLYGADATLRMAEKTFVKASYSVTKGNSIDRFISDDGGYNANLQGAVNSINSPTAIHLESKVDFEDLKSSFKGDINAYYRNRDAGYSGLGWETAQQTSQYGGAVLLGDKSEGLSLKGEFDLNENTLSKFERYLLQANLNGQRIFGSLGYGAESQNIINDQSAVGARLGLIFNKVKKNKLYLLGQSSLSSSGTYQDSSRFGLGVDAAILPKIRIIGEVVKDSLNEIGAQVKAIYDYKEGSQFYLGYDLSENRNNTGLGYNGLVSRIGGQGSEGDNSGAFTLGSRSRITKNTYVFGEETVYHGKNKDGFTRSYGVEHSPFKNLNLAFNFEKGIVNQLDRIAYGTNIGFGTKTKHISISGESREDINKISLAVRNTYVAKLNSKFVLNEQFTLLARGNLTTSSNNQQNIRDGEFKEFSFGLAYRPANNDRLNILGKYQFFYDTPTLNQVNVSGSTFYKQKANILSIDATLDLIKQLSLGLKYGFKTGQEDYLNGLGWLKNKSTIIVGRADFHLVKKIDIGLEARLKNQDIGKDKNFGWLAGGYYHVNNHAKLGLGYSFSEFSSDLTNLSIDNKGFFINLVTKF